MRIKIQTETKNTQFEMLINGLVCFSCDWTEFNRISVIDGAEMEVSADTSYFVRPHLYSLLSQLVNIHHYANLV